jgi:hypothetical protein
MYAFLQPFGLLTAGMRISDVSGRKRDGGGKLAAAACVATASPARPAGGSVARATRRPCVSGRAAAAHCMEWCIFFSLQRSRDPFIHIVLAPIQRFVALAHSLPHYLVSIATTATRAPDACLPPLQCPIRNAIRTRRSPHSPHLTSRSRPPRPHPLGVGFNLPHSHTPAHYPLSTPRPPSTVRSTTSLSTTSLSASPSPHTHTSTHTRTAPTASRRRTLPSQASPALTLKSLA